MSPARWLVLGLPFLLGCFLVLYIVYGPAAPGGSALPRDREVPVATEESATPSPVNTPSPPEPTCDARFGVVGGFWGLDGAAILDALCVTRYGVWGWGEPVRGKEKIQMVARPDIPEESLDAFILSHPGSYWEIGNEPNVPNQDNLSPAVYAETFHRWARRIRALDPSARILNGGIANYPDGASGVAYLAAFREAYRARYDEYPPVDVWNIHAYPPFYEVGGKLRSVCDTATLKSYVSGAAQYLREQGETRPLWMTEFGIDWGDDSDPCTTAFMVDIVTWLSQTRLVGFWNWYSLDSWRYDHSGSLIDKDGNLTDLGRTYRDLAMGRR